MTELEFHFQVCLRRIIINSAKYENLIKSYNLTQPDEKIKSKLRTLVRAGMASPHETGVYKGGTEYGGLDKEIALQSVELTGLIALVFLGEKKIVPTLLTRLRGDKTGNVRRQMVAGMALRYLTGQEIGSYLFPKEDLDLWEEWWERNESLSGNK